MPEVTMWRLVRPRYRASAFDGRGAQLLGGRFNSEGTTVVYAADTLALSVLEITVNLASYENLGERLAFKVSVPLELIEAASLRDMPKDWKHIPAGASTRRIGDEWVRQARSAVLCVPSVIVPHHVNYVLNPHHPDYCQIRIASPEMVKLDPRLG